MGFDSSHVQGLATVFLIKNSFRSGRDSVLVRIRTEQDCFMREMRAGCIK